MPALTIDSVTIPVRWDGHGESWEDSGEQTRSGAGYLRSNVTATLGRASVQTLETPSMLIAAGEAIEAHLAILGRRTADGSFVGDVPTQVYVRNLSREDDESAQTMRLTFEIHEATP